MTAMAPRATHRTKENSLRADTGEKRRERILAWMHSLHAPAQGGELAKRFRVSRQCVVQDIAILRAGGTEILATPQGYRLPENLRQLFGPFSRAGMLRSGRKRNSKSWLTTGSGSWTCW